jgi:cardiolipin synthase (CMP-forming)
VTRRFASTAGEGRGGLAALRSRAVAISPAELALLPNLVSLTRLPLAALFPIAIEAKGAAIAVLFAAGASDVLDGYLARRRGLATRTGAVVDPVCDKIFALSVVATLFARDMLPVWGIAALFAREILEAPLVIWMFVQRRGRALPEARANAPGKIATTFQFGAVIAALVKPAWLGPMLVASACVAALAGASYWRRELRRERVAGR